MAVKHPGRIKIRLAEMLTAKGILVSEYDLREAKGYYRIRQVWEDCPCWEGNGRMSNGMVAVFSSYFTMTECVRFGIEVIETETYGVFEIERETAAKERAKMNEGILLQFTGEGHGYMNGVTEYLTFHTVDEEDMREPAPGFVLANEERVMLPVWFPEENTLVVR